MKWKFYYIYQYVIVIGSIKKLNFYNCELSFIRIFIKNEICDCKVLIIKV